MFSKRLALAASVAMLAAGTAHATTISYQGSAVANQTTNFTSSTTLQKFDTDLGNLQSVQFTLGGTVVATIQFESRDAAPSTVTGTSAATISLTRPDGSSLVTVLPTQSRSQSETAYDGTLDFAGSSGDTFTNLAGTLSNTSALLTSATDLALFSAAGGGTIMLPVTAAGSSSATGAGNLVSVISTSAGANSSVTYVYNERTTSVPEPTTMALLGAGLVGAGLIRRRNQAG